MNWLKNKKQQIYFFIFSILFFLLINFLEFVNLYSIWRSVHTTFLFVFGVTSIFSFIFIFTKISRWLIWLKTVTIFSILSFLIIIFLPSNDGDFFVSSQILLSFIFVILYSLISLGILIYGFFIKN